MRTATHRREVFSWALYDWANSAFATTVMAGFFPVFFKEYWNQGAAVADSTFRLGLANSVASLAIMLCAPVLGAIADRGTTRKRFLAAFASLGAATTGGLFLVAAGQWLAASVLYALAIVGFSGANVFYDALLLAVAAERDRDRVSALGFALGYLGGGLLFAGNVFMTLRPHVFGLPDAAAAVRWSFLTVAAWWVLFSVPLLLWGREPCEGPRPLAGGALRAGFARLVDTAREIGRLKVVFRFLVAYWLYIDGVDTIVRMAVDYGLAIGLDANDLIVALLVTQFVGFPAAIVFGRIGERVGAKSAIQGALAVYVVVTLYAYFIDSAAEFYVLAIVVGLVQGGVQALSRSMFSRLIPPRDSAQFFGFYNMMGKFAAILGPLIVGVTSVLTGDPRLGIVSVLVLFVAGMLLLAGVPGDGGAADAATAPAARVRR